MEVLMRTILNLLSSWGKGFPQGNRDGDSQGDGMPLRGRFDGARRWDRTGRSVAAFLMHSGRAGTRPLCGNRVPALALTAGGMLLQARE